MNKVLLILSSCLLWSCQQDKYPQGKAIYSSICSNCHMENGEGLGELYPSLHDTKYLTTNLKDLPCIIIEGKAGSHLEGVAMPAHPQLKEAQLSNLINYMKYEWGDQEAVNIMELREWVEACE